MSMCILLHATVLSVAVVYAFAYYPRPVRYRYNKYKWLYPYGR